MFYFIILLLFSPGDEIISATEFRTRDVCPYLRQGVFPFLLRHNTASRVACSQRWLPNCRLSILLPLLWPSFYWGFHQSAAKKEAHLLVQSLWTREWVCSSKSSITRAFFPTPESHGRITDMDLCYPITQILPGHSFLNVHQHRFKFKASSHCSCSDIPESVSHFLFECPNFANLRHSFTSISLTTTGVWPPSLTLIPACPPLWRAMRSYISSTRRLSGRLGS